MFRAWIRGRIAGSWGSPGTHHGSFPPAWPCQCAPMQVAPSQMHFVASSHPDPKPGEAAWWCPSTLPLPWSFQPNQRAVPLFPPKRANLSQLLWGDMAKAHRYSQQSIFLELSSPFLSHELSVKSHKVLNHNLWKNISIHTWFNLSVESRF